MPVAAKNGRVVTYHIELRPLKSRDLFITWYFEIPWQIKTILSPLPVSTATKVARMVTYFEGTAADKLHYSLITWSS